MGSKPSKKLDPPKSNEPQLEDQIPVYNRPQSPDYGEQAKLLEQNLMIIQIGKQRIRSKLKSKEIRKERIIRKYNSLRKITEQPNKQSQKFVINSSQQNINSLDLSYNQFLNGLNQNDIKELEKQLESDDLSLINKTNTEQLKSRHLINRKLKQQNKKYGNYNKKYKDNLIDQLKDKCIWFQLRLNITINTKLKNQQQLNLLILMQILYLHGKIIHKWEFTNLNQEIQIFITLKQEMYNHLNLMKLNLWLITIELGLSMKVISLKNQHNRNDFMKKNKQKKNWIEINYLMPN